MPRQHIVSPSDFVGSRVHAYLGVRCHPYFGQNDKGFFTCHCGNEGLLISNPLGAARPQSSWLTEPL